MSVSLYRKYRPQHFSEVRGQDHVVGALSSALQSGNISHAYLFAGSRGTGKTSIARIFAREIGASPADIYEIDAASYRGINEMKELLSGISTLPFESKYKVYILDEVHMLTREAWNALLKSLEEPPAHVVFILATTELHKVLDTVKSRCQVFEFKKPSIETIIEMIEQGARDEKFTLHPGVAEVIAKAANGAFRDAWGVFEKVLHTFRNNGEVNKYEVLGLVSMPENEIAHEFIQSLIDKNLEKLLAIIQKITNLEHFFEYILETCRLIVLYRFAREVAESLMVGMSPDHIEKIKQWAGEKNIIDSKLMVDIIEILGEIKKTTMPNIVVELALIRILGNRES